MPTPVALSFSGGKDSVLALAALRAAGDWDVRALVATVIDDERVLSMHEVPERLVELQAASLRVPLARFDIPRGAPNALYEARLATALEPLRAQGVRHVAFGDLFLADIRGYRDALMARLGFVPVYPLWQRDTRALADAFVRDGYRGLTICVDGAKLGSEWAGREMDDAFFAALPPEIDACGENGEFHSFVYAGPGFAYRIRFGRGAVVTRGGFHYAPLVPVAGEACARCGAVFECGMQAGIERCWCADLPPAPIERTLRGCLCPRCLAQAVAARLH